MFKLIRIPLSLILFYFLQAAYPLDHYCTHLYIYYKISRMRIANEIEKKKKNWRKWTEKNFLIETDEHTNWEQIAQTFSNEFKWNARIKWMNNKLSEVVDWRAADSSLTSYKINSAVILGPYLLELFLFFCFKYIVY